MFTHLTVNQMCAVLNSVKYVFINNKYAIMTTNENILKFSDIYHE